MKYKPVINCRQEKFDTMQEAAKKYNIKCSYNIRKCCQGKSSYAGKYPDGKKIIWRHYY